MIHPYVVPNLCNFDLWNMKDLLRNVCVFSHQIGFVTNILQNIKMFVPQKKEIIHFFK